MGRIFFRFIGHQIKYDRKLINNVKRFPEMYDVSHPSYNDNIRKKRIWEIVGRNLQNTAQACEERWNQLVLMYQFFNLHDSLFEIMDQFLGKHIKFKDKVSCSLSSHETNAVELINGFEETNIEEITEASQYSPSPETGAFANYKHQMCSTILDSFYWTEGALESRLESPCTL